MEERAEKHPRNEKRDHRVAFFMSGVEVIEDGQISMDPVKVKGITDWPPPETL